MERPTGRAQAQGERTPPLPTPATVVITQRVRPERETEYLRWQREMNARCQAFAGFEGAEIVAPVAGVQEDFVIIFRFDSFEHLDAWLASDMRRSLLAQGAPFFAGEASQHVVASPQTTTRFASLLVSTRVRPGREREYREWQSAVDAEAAKFPGFQGNEVFPPAPGQQGEWVVLVRFDSPENLERWLHSEVRTRLLEQGEPLFEHVEQHTVGSGFPGWFRLAAGPGRTAEMPPDWKQAMTVLLVLYPTVMLLARWLSPHLGFLAPATSMFVGNVVSVALLTWVLMPAVSRALSFWLVPRGTARLRIELLGVGAILLGYAVSLLVFLAIS